MPFKCNLKWIILQWTLWTFYVYNSVKAIIKIKLNPCCQLFVLEMLFISVNATNTCCSEALVETKDRGQISVSQMWSWTSFMSCFTNRWICVYLRYTYILSPRFGLHCNWMMVLDSRTHLAPVRPCGIFFIILHRPGECKNKNQRRNMNM